MEGYPDFRNLVLESHPREAKQIALRKALLSTGIEGTEGMDTGATASSQLLTVEEVAAQLKLAPKTVRQWIRLGKLPALRLSPKVVRCEAGKIDRWLRGREAAWR